MDKEFRNHRPDVRNKALPLGCKQNPDRPSDWQSKPSRIGTSFAFIHHYQACRRLQSQRQYFGFSQVEAAKGMGVRRDSQRSGFNPRGSAQPCSSAIRVDRKEFIFDCLWYHDR